ncbi:23S rRNA pseudouridine(955/2504/2580) synthase RluC [Motilimonas sp. KMU-193]|uniref:23S rRNA pseudouridine(955/2504/2580) synthase RluC n=1 Tax=Motilimonas sp. KMU-193 TaxID=3388668 RepID=UPI00396B1EE0
MNELYKQVQFLDIDQEYQGQRIDNYLIARLKGVPKSLVYRIVRKGEVRVNKKRVKPEYKLQCGDQVRVPPLRVAEPDAPPSVKLNKVAALESQILHEDDWLIVLNKPSGLAVHGGSGLSFGVIEGLRALRPQCRFLELVHRIDRDTSGCLLIAKKRSALRHLHEQLRIKTMRKRYQALVQGAWPKSIRVVREPLLKKAEQSIVQVHPEGKASETRFKILQRYQDCTLVEASPVTGRTHQIRVHSACNGHPIAGDDKYGDEVFAEKMKQHGLGRLFLHAAELDFYHPGLEQDMSVKAPLSPELVAVLENLQRA